MQQQLDEVVLAAEFFTYVGMSQHKGYVTEHQLLPTLKDPNAFENYKRYTNLKHTA